MTIALLLAAFAGTPASINPEAVPVPVEADPTAVMGQLMFDTRLPAEIRVDGHTVAQLYLGGRLTVNASIGPHEVMVLTNGTPRHVAVDVPRVGTAVVMVGRTGITTGLRDAELAEAGSLTPVELRVAGDQDVMVQIGDQRWRINARASKGIEVPIGVHTISVRSGNGTVVWATGTLELASAGPVVLQLAEGRMPEVSGQGSAFHPGG
jgi:hypothetical protein